MYLGVGGQSRNLACLVSSDHDRSSPFFRVLPHHRTSYRVYPLHGGRDTTTRSTPLTSVKTGARPRGRHLGPSYCIPSPSPTRKSTHPAIQDRSFLDQPHLVLHLHRPSILHRSSDRLTDWSQPNQSLRYPLTPISSSTSTG